MQRSTNLNKVSTHSFRNGRPTPKGNSRHHRRRTTDSPKASDCERYAPPLLAYCRRSFVTSNRINLHITWLHLTNLARFRLPARRESAATAIRLAKETLQCLARATTLILQPLAIHIGKGNCNI